MDCGKVRFGLVGYGGGRAGIRVWWGVVRCGWVR